MKRARRVQFAVAERLAHLDAAAWDELTAHASVFLRRPFLTAFERAAPDNVSPRYALLFVDGRPLAAAVFQLVHIEGRSAIRSRSPVTQLFDERALIFGNLAAWGETGLALRPNATADEHALAWHEALRLSDRLRRFEKLEGHINVSFVKDASLLEDEAALKKAGYQRAPSGPDMVLDVDPGWADFPAYLASLASKRRRAVKKTLEDVTAAGYRVVSLELPAVEQYRERLEQLYGQVWASADVRPLKLSGEFFVELKRQLGADCVMVGLEKDGRLDGFGVSLRSGTTSTGYYLGFDKSVTGVPLYLRLLIAILEQGLAWKCARISMGRTAEEPKSRLGAQAGQAGLWVKHRTPPLNWAVGAILQSMEEPKIEAHRVFKE